MFDTYVQKSNNLQVWNEELSPTRRYVIIRVNAEDTITRVKVVTGDSLAELDTTGTLTQKYQARCIPGEAASELVVAEDTALLRPFVSDRFSPSAAVTPVLHPAKGQLLPIALVYERLKTMVGQGFDDSGIDQERNRGAPCIGLCARRWDTPDIRTTGGSPMSDTSCSKSNYRPHPRSTLVW